MQRAWLKQKERGSPLLLKLIRTLAQRFGRSIGRLLLYPITLYFVLFVPKARRASKNYLSRVLERPAGFSDIFRHFHTFAATILDRVFLLGGRFDEFEISVHGYDEVMAPYHRGKGCILLGSHLGSFELLRALALRDDGIEFRALMYEDNAEKINAVLNSINSEITDTIIPIGQTDSLLQVMSAMDRGEIVGILGDRVALDDKIISCRFFGEECEFPAGPMIMSGLLQVPVVLFFGIYSGGNRYDIHFELLTEGFELQRPQRMEQLTEMTQKYVSRLEHYCRKSPYNWFNFYDYWKDEGREKS